MVKNPPVMQETLVQSMDQEDPLKEGMATHSSILDWKIPWTEGYSPWGHKELDRTEVTEHSHMRVMFCLFLTFYIVLGYS